VFCSSWARQTQLVQLAQLVQLQGCGSWSSAWGGCKLGCAVAGYVVHCTAAGAAVMTALAGKADAVLRGVAVAIATIEVPVTAAFVQQRWQVGLLCAATTAGLWRVEMLGWVGMCFTGLLLRQQCCVMRTRVQLQCSAHDAKRCCYVSCVACLQCTSFRSVMCWDASWLLAAESKQAAAVACDSV
jgi:hypothetical protein